MQRRAAAAYVVFFLVMAAGLYAFIATAHAPAVTVESPDQTLGEGDPIEAGDRTYTVASIEAKKAGGGGGHGGGGGGIERSATLEYTNQSFPYTEKWIRNTSIENARITEQGGTVTVEFPSTRSLNLTFPEESIRTADTGEASDAVVVNFSVNDTEKEFVPVPNATIDGVSDPKANNSTIVVDYYAPDVNTYTVLVPDNSTVQLREQPRADTVRRNGNLSVVVDRDGDGSEELVPISQYGRLHRVSLSDGDTVQYRGNESELRIARPDSSVLAVPNRNASLHWTAPKTFEVEASHESNVTLGSTTYLAYFPDNSTMYLTTDFQSYERKVERASEFKSRMNGFWGISILSVLAAILIAAFSFLPYKDT